MSSKWLDDDQCKPIGKKGCQYVPFKDDYFGPNDNAQNQYSF